MSSANNWITNIKVTNTKTNTDGIMITGANNVVERCTFDLCRDKAVGITGSGARGNVVAYCRIENCGSQADPWTDGRGILVTNDGSGRLVANYISHCNRGITINYPYGFADIRNNRINDSLSPASGNGLTIVGRPLPPTR